MIDKIRIQNLRALKDTDYIDLKPLTILVGRNSSGKSTFLRFFPLMKQTLETRTNEPILWYSPSYVDFGSFKESLNHESENRTITFEFNLKVDKSFFSDEVSFYLNRQRFYRTAMPSTYIENIVGEKTDEVDLNLKITFSKEKINKIEMQLWDHAIEILFPLEDTNKEMEFVEIIINGKLIKDVKLITKYLGNYSNMLPRIFTVEDEKITPSEIYFSNELFKIFKSYVPANTKDSTIDEVISSIELGNSNTILQSLWDIKSSSKNITRNLANYKLNHPKFIEIKNNYFGMILNSFIDICNNELSSFFSSVRYVAPIRASAERYYRIQGLALDEIDPQGTNIPMLLNNMSNKDKRNFNRWIKENFHFEISADSTGGHTSLYIKYENGTKINLADTGFGYSQILPIILVMWQAVQTSENYARYKYKKMRIVDLEMFTIVIEQPELHLHPSLQGVLIDTFAKIIKVSKGIGIDLKIIIETHSETMINRVGQLIATNFEGFNEDLVKVLMFNSSDPYNSNIKSTGYTDEGYLTSWPIGFFSPEEI
ncbi:AAA family ATPase [Cytobacillus gottheilii]|uniref:AAA family ATPase n=1 Tax=Cytobacillus gottheilii TaxID=859144 RepID=UPI0024956D1A|nr:AAA family ATPase [Cytobacillus gottheilii]